MRENKLSNFAKLQILSDKIDKVQITLFCIFVNFIVQEFEVFQNCSAFLVPVFFVRENLRELRENKKHIIQTLDIRKGRNH